MLKNEFLVHFLLILTILFNFFYKGVTDSGLTSLVSVDHKLFPIQQKLFDLVR